MWRYFYEAHKRWYWSTPAPTNSIIFTRSGRMLYISTSFILESLWFCITQVMGGKKAIFPSHFRINLIYWCVTVLVKLGYKKNSLSKRCQVDYLMRSLPERWWGELSPVTTLTRLQQIKVGASPAHLPACMQRMWCNVPAASSCGADSTASRWNPSAPPRRPRPGPRWRPAAGWRPQSAPKCSACLLFSQREGPCLPAQL